MRPPKIISVHGADARWSWRVKGAHAYICFSHFRRASWPQQLASGQCNTTLSTIAPSYNDIDQSIDRFVHTGLTTHARRAARRTTHVGIVEPRASRPAPGLHWTYARCMRCKTVTEYHISPLLDIHWYLHIPVIPVRGPRGIYMSQYETSHKLTIEWIQIHHFSPVCIGRELL